MNPFKAKENDEFLIEATISRAQALKALQEIMPGVKKIEEIVENKDMGGFILEDVWADEFENIYHDDVMQERLIKALKGITNEFEFTIEEFIDRLNESSTNLDLSLSFAVKNETDNSKQLIAQLDVQNEYLGNL